MALYSYIELRPILSCLEGVGGYKHSHDKKKHSSALSMACPQIKHTYIPQCIPHCCHYPLRDRYSIIAAVTIQERQRYCLLLLPGSQS